MKEPTDYPIGPDSSIADLVKVLNKIKDDAIYEASPIAIRVATSGHHDEIKDKRDDVLWLMAQAEFIKSLLWALDGTAVEDGCEPSARLVYKT